MGTAILIIAGALCGVGCAVLLAWKRVYGVIGCVVVVALAVVGAVTGFVSRFGNLGVFDFAVILSFVVVRGVAHTMRLRNQSKP